MASLVLYDTMTREKRPFEPADPGRVTMYVCGPTVYNYAHIGNFRPVVVFDVLFRLLRRLYGEEAVVYARNFTDVDDRINAAAIEQGVPISAITEKFADAYHEDTDALGALRPTLEPRATGHIPKMVELIGRLVSHQKAYAAEGHVLFDVAAFADYGRLSKRSLDDMIAGARVEVAPYKKNPADFVLWKPSRPGEPVWESPWGPGRPGWHLECSAMIEAALGELPIDIHGGGLDLIFPHHENEIAQSVCAHDHGEGLARVWMHNGFLDMAGEKMSKSIGNVVLLHDLKEQVPGEVIRWALLSAHYRQPLSWTERLVQQSRNSLDRLYGVLQRASHVQAAPDVGAPDASLLNDLDTPGAFAALSALATDLDRAVTAGSPGAAERKAEVLALAGLLGVLKSDPESWFKGSDDEDLVARIESLIAARDEARRNKDWAEADRIRAELTALGVEIMDGPNGATWRFKQPPAA